PVLVLAAFQECASDARRGAKIHVGDAHAALDVLLAEIFDLLVPLDAVRADAVIDRIEIVPAVCRFEDRRRGGALECRARSHRARDGCEPGVLQERAATESV